MSRPYPPKIAAAVGKTKGHKIKPNAIIIEHLATGQVAFLNVFGLTEFSDNISTNYNSTEVYGRMDPIKSYQGSTRNISLGIRTSSKAGDGVKKFVSQMMRFQYPVYSKFSDSQPNALAIQSPPLVCVWYGDWIQGKVENTGLIAAMKGFSYTPNVGFTPKDSPYVRFGKSSVKLSAKNLNMKFDFDILHTETPGWHFQEGQGDDPGKYDWIAGGLTSHFGPSGVK
mgnify:FL=1|jgi:hypothetical protein|tara:strand:+ start:6474 stop:7151 length:678 start_codon:yes stop_codon:yes gene_type:complete